MSTTPTTESFSQHEDVQLANAYILVCENRKIRKDSAIFWKIIADDFNDKKSSDDMRDCETLKNRWNIIDKNVSKYLRYLGIAGTQLGTGYVPNDRVCFFMNGGVYYTDNILTMAVSFILLDKISQAIVSLAYCRIGGKRKLR